MTIFVEFPRGRVALPVLRRGGWSRAGGLRPGAGADRMSGTPGSGPWPLPLRIAIHAGGAGVPWLLLARGFGLL